MLCNFLNAELFPYSIAGYLESKDTANLEQASTTCRQVAKEIWKSQRAILEGLHGKKERSLSDKSYTIFKGGMENLNEIKKEFFAKEVYKPEDLERIKYMSSYGNEGEVDIKDFLFFSEKGLLNPVVRCLQKAEITEELRGEALFTSVDNEHNEIAKLILNHGPASEEKLIESFLAACSTGNLELMELLLSAGSFEEDVCVEGVRELMIAGEARGIIFMLENVRFSNPQLEEFFVTAAEFGQKHVLSFLLARMAISNDAKNEAFIAAGSRGHFDIQREFLQSFPISDESKSEALHNIASAGVNDIFMHILTTTPLHADDRGEALCSALEAHQLSLAKMVLNSGEIDRSFLSFAMNICIREGLSPFLTEILNSRSYQYPDLIAHCFDNDLLDSPEVLHFLLLSYNLDQTLIENAIVKAIVSGNSTALTLLIDYREIASHHKLLDYLTAAVHSKKESSVEVLVEKFLYPSEILHNMAVNAQNAGNMNMARILNQAAFQSQLRYP